MDFEVKNITVTSLVTKIFNSTLSGQIGSIRPETKRGDTKKY